MTLNRNRIDAKLILIRCTDPHTHTAVHTFHPVYRHTYLMVDFFKFEGKNRLSFCIIWILLLYVVFRSVLILYDASFFTTKHAEYISVHSASPFHLFWLIVFMLKSPIMTADTWASCFGGKTRLHHQEKRQKKAERWSKSKSCSTRKKYEVFNHFENGFREKMCVSVQFTASAQQSFEGWKKQQILANSESQQNTNKTKHAKTNYRIDVFCFAKKF